MVPIYEHSPASAGDPVNGPGEPRANGFHAAAERIAIVRFDDEVRVVAEERVVDEAEVVAVASGRERAFDLADDPGVAERWNVGQHA
jgi:hypothetical protein